MDPYSADFQLLPYTIYSSPELNEPELENAVEALLQWGKEHLSPTEYATWARGVRHMGHQMQHTIAAMKLQNKSPEDIARVVQQCKARLVSLQHDSSQQLIQYGKIKTEVFAQRKEVRDAIETAMPDFFSIDPFSFESSPPIVPEVPSQFDYSQMPPGSGDIITGKIAKEIEHRYGKTRGIFSDWVLNTFKTAISEDSESPWRDRVVTAAVHVGMTEAVAYCLPHRIPAYVAMTATHILADGARLMTPTMDRIANKIEIECRGFYRGSDEIEDARAMLIFAQIPRDLLQTIHHEVTEVVAHLCDKIGVTDKNIKKITKGSLEFIAKNSPELQEERLWEMAARGMAKDKKM